MWACPDPVDLDEALVDRLPSGIEEINITGGEPFLHPKINAIVGKLENKGCRVIINSNGLVKIAADNALLKLKNVGIRFSLDGIGDRHDRLRGVNGNFEKVLRQIEGLQSAGFTDLGIVSTFSDANWDQVLPVYELSRKLRVGFTCALAANSTIFYRNESNRLMNTTAFVGELQRIIGREIGSMRMRGLGKALFVKELARFASSKVKSLDCSAGRSFFFLAATGDVYACNMRDLPMGNLRTSKFEDLWFSALAGNQRSIASRCTQPCWTMCNAKQILKDNILTYCFRFLLPLGVSHD
jgi:radical SAM protein with 4Fe4S-binding SPASM domain